MTDRREFLIAGATMLAGMSIPPHASAARPMTLLPGGNPEDEEFWARVRANYDLQSDVVNLDHGWTNPAPRAALDDAAARMRVLEGLPAEHIVKFWEEASNTHVREALANVMGVPGTEIALVRNATEALNTVFLGLPMRAGDEIVCGAHDYYATLDALAQRSARDGVVLRIVRLPVPAQTLDEIVAAYEAAITPRTRLVLLTHPSNLTGQMLPVARIAAAAHKVGAEVVVDGAQSLGLVEDPVKSLDCDYYGASAHKWLGTPVGLGVLWMRPEHTSKVWPLVPPDAGTTGMGRYEWIGTNPEFLTAAALPALALHEHLGETRKAERLQYLRTHWLERARAALPGLSTYTTDGAGMSGGLTTIEIPGADHDALQKALRANGFLVQAMLGGERRPEINGIRVTPNVYTSLAEIDRFVDALIRLV